MRKMVYTLINQKIIIIITVKPWRNNGHNASIISKQKNGQQ